MSHTLHVEDYEVKVLLEWHLERESEAAGKKDYQLAHAHSLKAIALGKLQRNTQSSPLP